ncbi:MAG: family 10 glycosylhydrolase [Gemmatimonadota bacterium]
MRAHGAHLLAIAFVVTGCTRVGLPTPPPPPDLPPPSASRGAPAARPNSSGGVPAPDVGGGLSGALPPVLLPTETGDVRALWIVRTALSHPDSARAAVRRAAESGFNTLLVQVRGRGDAFYESRWEPRPESMPGSVAPFDPLGTVLDEAHRRGLRVHAWVNVHLVASAVFPPRDPRHLVNADPGRLAVPRALASELFERDPREPAYLGALIRYAIENAARVEGLFTNPAHPEVQDHLDRVIADLVSRYPLDGVHLDYLRYPSPEFDYSRVSLEKFRAWARPRIGVGADGAESRWPRDPLAYVTAFPSLWDWYRTEQVTTTMERLFRIVRSVRPGTIVSASVHPDGAVARRERFQDWEAWLPAGIVDLVIPMAYGRDGALFEAQIRNAARADPRRIWAGLGIYQDSFEGAVAKGRAARGLGVGGIALFSYDWSVGAEGIAVAEGAYLARFAREVWGSGY